jgi:hypothetical protein
MAGLQGFQGMWKHSADSLGSVDFGLYWGFDFADIDHRGKWVVDPGRRQNNLNKRCFHLYLLLAADLGGCNYQIGYENLVHQSSYYCSFESKDS